MSEALIDEYVKMREDNFNYIVEELDKFDAEIENGFTGFGDEMA